MRTAINIGIAIIMAFMVGPCIGIFKLIFKLIKIKKEEKLHPERIYEYPIGNNTAQK